MARRTSEVPVVAPSREDFKTAVFTKALTDVRTAMGLSRPKFAELVTERARETGLLSKLPAARAGSDPKGLAISAVFLTALEGVLPRKDSLPTRPTPRTLLLIDNAIRKEHPEVADRLWRAAGYKPEAVQWMRTHPERVGEVRMTRLHEIRSKFFLVQPPKMRTAHRVGIDPQILALPEDEPTQGLISDIDIPRAQISRGDILLVRRGRPRRGQFEVRAGRQSWELVAHSETGPERVLAASGPEEDRKSWGVVNRTLAIRKLRAS